jgi:MFS transporter, PAT family, solute carrier family 33 (acetyl-CoA transportor), member 1
MPRPHIVNPGLSTSLDSVQITPRTPRSARRDHDDIDADYVVGSGSTEEVEMSLLAEDERRRADAGFEEEYAGAKHKAPLSSEDKRAMALLCTLCAWVSFPSLAT